MIIDGQFRFEHAGSSEPGSGWLPSSGFSEVHTDDANCLIQQLLTPNLASRLKSAAGVKAGRKPVPFA